MSENKNKIAAYMSEIWLADYVANSFDYDFFYVVGRKKWFVREDASSTPGSDQPLGFVEDVSRKIFSHIIIDLGELSLEIFKTEPKLARAVASWGTVKAVERLLRSHPSCSMSSEQWEAENLAVATEGKPT